MKPLNETNIPEASATPRQRLMEDILAKVQMTCGVKLAEKDVMELLSEYDIKMCELTSIEPVFPDFCIGKRVHIILADKWDLHGEVIDVLCRDISYSSVIVRKLLEHPDMSEEQRDMLKYTIYEEVKPKIYHRVVLNEDSQGILLIPYIKGVIIEQE